MSTPLLSIRNLSIEFQTRQGTVRVVDQVNLEINKGKTLCLVGESGCGKSVVALAIMGLLAENARMQGEIWFQGKNIVNCDQEEMRQLRGKEIAMVFEQPMSCLNPVLSIGCQIAEAVSAHKGCSPRAAEAEARKLMEQVGIPARRCRDYPHQFSGGMQQRAMIAIALACRPKLLIADEPTTSLDVTVQAQILELLKELIVYYQTSLLLITHDLGVVAEMADTVAVMYAGTILEKAGVGDFFLRPEHPYAAALLAAVQGKRLQPIPGAVPNLTEIPTGCPFYPRCTSAFELCRRERPKLRDIGGRMVRCHLVQFNSSRAIV